MTDLEIPKDEVAVRAAGGHGHGVVLVPFGDVDAGDGVLVEGGEGGVAAVRACSAVQRLELLHRTKNKMNVLTL